MQPEHLENIFIALNEAKVRYLVAGGLAVMAHGYLRMTRDLDLILALDGKNPEQALTVFDSLGYQPNAPVALMDFLDPGKRQAWRDEKGMQVFQIISENLVDCPIDIFVDEPIEFSEMYAARVEYDLKEALKIPVIGLEHLRQLKQAAGRPRDLLDLEELNQMNNSDEER
jgi:hypothetical protein